MTEKDPINFWISGNLQERLEEAVRLDLLPSDAQRPFDNKYKAREIYAAVLQELEEVASKAPEAATNESCRLHLVYFLLHFFLANNYFDTEEYTVSSKEMKFALADLEAVTDKTLLEPFKQYLMHFYTNFGFVCSQNEGFTEGLKWLEMAKGMYSDCRFYLLKQGHSVVNFKAELVGLTSLRGVDEETKAKMHRPLMEGGVSQEQVEKIYTQTIFFLAQVHSKLGNVEESASYSFETMRRQVKALRDGTTLDFDYPDFTNNALGLAAYYMGFKHFAQADTIIRGAMKVVPQTMRVEQGAFFSLLGQIYLGVFELNLKHLQADPDAPDPSGIVNRNFGTLLDEPGTDFRTISLFENYDAAKAHFKTSFGYFKQAMELAPLEGNVSDYSEVVKNISKLYATTLPLETDDGRIDAIQDRRAEYVAKALTDLNPKIYEKQFIELTAELAEIQTQNFERYQKAFQKDNKGVKRMARAGKEALKNWETVAEYFRQYKEENVQSFINCLYNKARILTRLFEKDPATQRANLQAACECYEQVKATLLEVKAKTGSLDAALEQQLVLATDFASMLPVRIASIK